TRMGHAEDLGLRLSLLRQQRLVEGGWARQSWIGVGASQSEFSLPGAVIQDQRVLIQLGLGP
ncbi:MAG: hypothetical protein RJB38_251, partial [Pseudomonadota bacterium]